MYYNNKLFIPTIKFKFSINFSNNKIKYMLTNVIDFGHT